MSSTSSHNVTWTLDEGVARELRQLADEGAPRGLAVTLDGRERLLLEAREVARQEPVGQRDAASGEAEARTLARRLPAEIVRAQRGGQLRGGELAVAGETVAAVAGARC